VEGKTKQVTAGENWSGGKTSFAVGQRQQATNLHGLCGAPPIFWAGALALRTHQRIAFHAWIMLGYCMMHTPENTVYGSIVMVTAHAVPVNPVFSLQSPHSDAINMTTRASDYPADPESRRHNSSSVTRPILSPSAT
jgi:hypothetical protein